MFDERGYFGLRPLAACLTSRTNSTVLDMNVDAMAGDALVRDSAARALVNFCEVYYYRYKDSPLVQPSYLAQIREAMRPVVPVLVKALNDEDWHVAMWAADALGDMALEPDLAVPALVKSLDHPQPYVKKAAIDALGNFGEAARSAVPALTRIALADPEGYVGGTFAADALKKIVPQTKP